jgi:hypothetical protein
MLVAIVKSAKNPAKIMAGPTFEGFCNEPTDSLRSPGCAR